MHRSFRTVLAIVPVALIAGLGCAMSAPADLTPEVDPTLPGVEVGNDPKPAPGSKGSDTADSGSSGGSTSKDSGATPSVAPDAAPAPTPTPSPSVAKPSAGEVLISEVMYDTFGTEPASEWIELHSKASGVRALTGLTLKDGGGRTHVIGAGITIAPGAYVVLARNKAGAISAKVPATSIAYDYGTGLPDNAGVILANGTTGGVSLLDGTATIASAPYGGWFSQSGGSSAQLHVLDASSATSKASWCLSLNPWTAGSDKGTPGAADDCP
jgi:hypothetical protein